MPGVTKPSPRELLLEVIDSVTRLLGPIEPREVLSDEADVARAAHDFAVTEHHRGRLIERRMLAFTALERVADGTYGACLDCGATIPEPRLRTRPETETCTPCQEKRERIRSALMAPERVRLREVEDA